MDNIKEYANQLMDLIAEGEMKLVIEKIQTLLKGSPAYKLIIQQSARYNELMESINLGTLNYETANIERNKIRRALMDMIYELENHLESNKSLSQEIGKVLEEEAKIANNSTINIQGDNNQNINIQGSTGSEFNININKD